MKRTAIFPPLLVTLHLFEDDGLQVKNRLRHSCREGDDDDDVGGS